MSDHLRITRRQFLTSSAAAGAALAAPAATWAQAPAAPRPVEQITVLQLDEVASLDPLADFTNPGLQMHAHILEPLIDFTGPDFKMTPKLAVSWDNPTPTKWRFKLRPNVTWHDGTPFTAEDVKYTFEKAKGPTSVKNRYLARVQKIDILDPLTIQIELDAAYAPLLGSWVYLYIVQKKAYEAGGTAEFGKKPVGTGPYRMVDWQKQQQLVLEAYDKHWNGPHTPKRIVVRGIREAATRLAELQTGRADIIFGVPIELAKTVEANPQLKLIVQQGVRPPYFVFNAKKPPFDDRRVRQAMNYAVDRESIVNGILQGYGEVRIGPFSPTQASFSPAGPQYKLDVDRARALLKEAGKDGGFGFTWLLRKDFMVKDEEIMQVLANQLGKVGVKVNLQFLESSVYTPRYANGEFEMAVNAWGKSLEADSVITGLRWLSENSKFYGNPQVDEAINKARATFGVPERTRVYQDADRLLREDAVGLFTHAQSELYGTNRRYPWQPWAYAGNAGLLTYYVPKS
jgi:peptide/nickel transport system substrate-binding protein